jgi:periplasmic protein TonB
MLEDSLFESNARKKVRNPMTIFVSVVVHVVTVTILLLIPLLQTQAVILPSVDMSLFLPKIESAPRVVEVIPSRRPSAASNSSDAIPVFSSPLSIPSKIALVDEPVSPERFLLFSGGPTITMPSQHLNQILELSAPTDLLPPTPPLPPPIVKSNPIRISTGSQAAKLIYQIKPAYPPLARQARIQGVVILEALIGKDGSISTLRVISGHTLLTQAAVDAVKQWKYQPTLLNGEPTEVVTTVTVTFTFQQ